MGANMILKKHTPEDRTHGRVMDMADPPRVWLKVKAKAPVVETSLTLH